MAPVAPRRGRLLGPLWADPDEILRGRRARVWLWMMRISLGWVELCGCSGRKTEKKASKTDDFFHSWPGSPDSAANCSAPCGPIRLKFYVVNGLGYGYKRCEFSRYALRYAGAAAEKPAKTDDFRRFWPGLPDGAADCSAPCGPIWPKFCVVNGLGYGY